MGIPLLFAYSTLTIYALQAVSVSETMLLVVKSGHCQLLQHAGSTLHAATAESGCACMGFDSGTADLLWGTCAVKLVLKLHKYSCHVVSQAHRLSCAAGTLAPRYLKTKPDLDLAKRAGCALLQFLFLLLHQIHCMLDHADSTAKAPVGSSSSKRKAAISQMLDNGAAFASAHVQSPEAVSVYIGTTHQPVCF